MVRTSPGKLQPIGHTGRLTLDPLAFLERQRTSDPAVALRLTGRECFLINTAESAVDERTATFENRAGAGQFVLVGQVGDPLHFLGRQRSSRAPRGRSQQEPEPVA
ncbi:hypothetical protein [Streptomyces fulvoviolaceus]|uniref:hypothetical protein n=1 Tax=Streptomyces fulvoviolaceus TaxID=285535 RepID=UPI0004C6F760|nr:hypothetical protein [Streptomyces fulvoviolaceus]